jgi:hypothetical protein
VCDIRRDPRVGWDQRRIINSSLLVDSSLSSSSSLSHTHASQELISNADMDAAIEKRGDINISKGLR